VNPSNPGTAGTGGAETAGIGGTGGAATAGIGGTTGIGGTGGGTAGTGGTGGAATAGIGGTTGIGGTGGGRGMDTGGTGGSGGSVPLPACPARVVTFGVCFGSNTDTSSTIEARTSGAATIEAVGSGATPVSNPCWHTIGVGAPSQWWFQARAADNRLWTIGVRGLGGTPIVRQGDAVALDLDWRLFLIVPGASEPNGVLQLSDAAGTPLLWAGSTTGVRPLPNPNWISFMRGDYVCGSVDTFCDRRESNVIATVNGTSTTLPPYGAATLGGYSLQVTYFAHLCGDYTQAFHAAAVKVSPTTTP